MYCIYQWVDIFDNTIREPMRIATPTEYESDDEIYFECMNRENLQKIPPKTNLFEGAVLA